MTNIQRVLGGAGVTAVLLLVGAPAAQADPLYPPSVQPTQSASVSPQADPDDDPAVADDSLAFTGSDVAVVGGTAALLVVAGGVLVARTRRRGEHV